MRKWESEKHRSWGMQVEGSRGHVATDGSSLGKTGRWEACGWAVVQLDYDEEMEPLHGMYGSMEAKEKKHMSHCEKFVKKERRCTQLCSMLPASTAWQNNGSAVKSSGPIRKESGFLWIRRGRRRSMGRSGVRKQVGIDVCGVEEEANTLKCQENEPDHNFCQKVWKNSEGVIWEVMIWSEEWTDREKF